MSPFYSTRFSGTYYVHTFCHHPPQRNPAPMSCPPHFLLLAPGNPHFLSFSVDLPILDIPYTWNHICDRFVAQAGSHSEVCFGLCLLFFCGAGITPFPPGFIPAPASPPPLPSPPRNLSRKQELLFSVIYYHPAGHHCCWPTDQEPITVGGDVEYSDWLKPESQSTPLKWQ